MRPPAARRTGKLMAQNTPLSFQFVPFCATLIFFFAFHPPINLRALLFAFTSVRLLIDICARFSTTFPAARRFPPLSLPFFCRLARRKTKRLPIPRPPRKIHIYSYYIDCSREKTHIPFRRPPLEKLARRHQSTATRKKRTQLCSTHATLSTKIDSYKKNA